MRRKTFAHNGIIIGVLIGILVYAYTENIVLTVIATVAVSAICWFVIKWIEKLLYRGMDAGVQAIKKGIQNNKDQKGDE